MSQYFLVEELATGSFTSICLLSQPNLVQDDKEIKRNACHSERSEESNNEMKYKHLFSLSFGEGCPQGRVGAYYFSTLALFPSNKT